MFRRQNAGNIDDEINYFNSEYLKRTSVLSVVWLIVRERPSLQMQKETWQPANRLLNFKMSKCYLWWRYQQIYFMALQKKSDLRNMEKYLFKVSFELENSVRKIRDLNVKKENTYAYLEWEF
jgi:hypothetical protein